MRLSRLPFGSSGLSGRNITWWNRFHDERMYSSGTWSARGRASFAAQQLVQGHVEILRPPDCPVPCGEPRQLIRILRVRMLRVDDHIPAGVERFRPRTRGRQLMRVTVQQLASVERQRLIVESDRVIGPSVREVFAIWEVRQVDRSKSFQFNGAVRFDALEQVQRRLVVHPPVIMVADGRVQMTATQLPQAILMGI